MKSSISSISSCSLAIFTMLATAFSTAAMSAQELTKMDVPAVDYSAWRPAWDEVDAEKRWQLISKGMFGEREIQEDAMNQVVDLITETRTKNDSFVPVAIDTSNASASKKQIKKVYLTVDYNPAPVSGVFDLPSGRNLERIETSLRVNGYTYVRAIAETTEGELFMDKHLVKSRGVACAAPPITDPELAKETMGDMRFDFYEPEFEGDPVKAELVISHPNATGLQRDQISLLMIPSNYVQQVLITFNDEVLMKADTSISISENPTFKFTFHPNESGELRAEILDSQGNEYSMEQQVEPASLVAMKAKDLN